MLSLYFRFIVLFFEKGGGPSFEHLSVESPSPKDPFSVKLVAFGPVVLKKILNFFF